MFYAIHISISIFLHNRKIMNVISNFKLYIRKVEAIFKISKFPESL